MYELHYKVTRVELDTAAVPQWLADRLEQWFAAIASEPLPEQLNGLLRRLEDEIQH